MKTTLVLAAIAAAFVATPGPAAAQPGLDDPELLAWMHAANAAQHARYEALASREDAHSLLMAMQLVHPMFPLRDDFEGEIAAEQARAWALLERAARAEPQHPVVAWTLATCPPAALDACRSAAALAQLQALDDSRGAAHMWLAQSAQERGDEAAVDTHLQAAAQAPAFSAFEHELSELIWSAWETIDFPDAGPEHARAYAGHVAIDPDAFVEQIVAMSVVARIAAQTTPALSYPLEVCGLSDDGAATAAPRREPCLAIFASMAGENGTLVQRLVAEEAMVRMSLGTVEAEGWKRRLRTTVWVYERVLPEMASLSTRHDPDYYAAWRDGGEWKALLGVLERRRIDLQPPDEWMPESERMRALLGEDDATATAPDPVPG